MSDTPGGDARKKDKYVKTFANFPQCKLEITGVNKVNGEIKPHRWERIKESYLDFDIFIDDNYAIIESARINLPADKIYVLPDYMCSRHLQYDNVYHLKTSVSDLKDEDFEKVAEE